MKRPQLERWRQWSWDDYLAYFLSGQAAKARARRSDASVASVLTTEELTEFCEPVRARLAPMFSGNTPAVSIQMPCRNDQDELLATLVSYAMLDVAPGEAELIVADNASSDRTGMVIKACGVKGVFAPEPGMGRARRAAYDAMSPSAEFVWLTDSDARVLPPIWRFRDLQQRSPILKTNLRCFNGNDRVIGVSTGVVYEYTYPVFRLLRAIAVFAGKAPRIHCWSGPNQFVRRSALDAIGGINSDVPYRAREDHQRMYELARYGKRIGAQMLSAATIRALCDPVYHSGRRRGTFRDILIAAGRGRQVVHAPRDRFGFPIHPADRVQSRIE